MRVSRIQAAENREVAFFGSAALMASALRI